MVNDAPQINTNSAEMQSYLGVDGVSYVGYIRPLDATSFGTVTQLDLDQKQERLKEFLEPHGL